MRSWIISIGMLLVTSSVLGQVRKVVDIKDWNFSHDNKTWEKVSVPHDWAISGPFDKKWDLQVVAIEQNGEKEKSEKSGRSGALPWIGEGYYETTINVDQPFGVATLEFDGAMAEPIVYVNGHEAGQWKYGYNAFRVDATPYLTVGENKLAVHLKNVEESSRWYPGAGLYRPVKLVLTDKIHFDSWGTYIRTVSANANRAGVSVTAKVAGLESIDKDSKGKSNKIATRMSLYDATGKEVAFVPSAGIDKDGNVGCSFVVHHPNLWSPESPYLYILKMQVVNGDQVLDERVERVGIRTISIDSEKGFQLNGQSRKFQGVCLHHDLGPLGAAVNKAALIRQVKILKDMGCDAIRTSHNMPSTMQMEVYDSLGMMVMAESFDMWIYPKCKNGYARFFEEWNERDMENLVLNHRNHPSLVMWSIGNEIPEQWSDEGREISRRLQDICHRLDPSRTVTQGMDRAEQALKSGFAQIMDVPGFNYRVHKYGKNIEQLPQGFLLGSETASTVSSRGVYKFPVEFKGSQVHPDGQCNSYDNEWCSWSNLPEDDFEAMDDLSYTIGQFVWTGFDYLGEPTPYDGYWPSRSSYFGICDLAGLPKDRYYLYRSIWNKKEHTIHLLPHWTWPGREGENTPVYCYTDYPSAELFVNGKSQGRISKNKSSKYDRYRLRWNDVKYEPGELKVVVYDEQGKNVGQQIIKTAGKPAALKLEADRTVLCSDGEDLAYVTVSLIDKDGTEIPDAADQLTFEVKGAGSFRAACNGDATSLESFTQPSMKLFSGKVVVTVQAGQKAGKLMLTVKDKTNKRIKAKTITIDVK